MSWPQHETILFLPNFPDDLLSKVRWQCWSVTWWPSPGSRSTASTLTPVRPLPFTVSVLSRITGKSSAGRTEQIKSNVYPVELYRFKVNLTASLSSKLISHLDINLKTYPLLVVRRRCGRSLSPAILYPRPLLQAGSPHRCHHVSHDVRYQHYWCRTLAAKYLYRSYHLRSRNPWHHQQEHNSVSTLSNVCKILLYPNTQLMITWSILI